MLSRAGKRLHCWGLTGRRPQNIMDWEAHYERTRGRRSPSIHYDSGRSIIIRHTVKPGHRDHYETWLRQIIAAAAQFSGHQGVHVVRPPEGHDTFEIAVRFSHPDEADTWLNSDVRRELISGIVPALASDEHVEIRTGIDYWFTPPTSKAKQPTRWKQWLITTAVIWPLTLIVPMVFQPIFNQLPVLALWGCVMAWSQQLSSH